MCAVNDCRKKNKTLKNITMKKKKNFLFIFSDSENSFFYKALCIEFLSSLVTGSFNIRNRYTDIIVVFNNTKDCKNCFDYIKNNS